MKIGDYFSGIGRSLRQIKGAEIHGQVTCLASDDYNGLVRCRVLFWNDSYLDIYEVVSIELGYPVKIHYAYTFMQSGEQIFRYDNAPHHPEIDTHPHHKHSGAQDTLYPAQEPALSQILSEIEKLLAKE
jgi:hypothetical protein